jgi:long-chain fatty acid transport protein
MNPSVGRDSEYMSGAGLQFGLRSEVVPGLQARASYQSEIDMGSGSNYRGVFSEEGDFDVPASASFGVDLQAARSAWFTFDVSRIMYSDTQAYTNSLMPTGATSLLGDGGSPNFAWQDQTVYQFGMKFKSNGGIIWNVGYATNQRPEPSSASLARALAPEFAEDHLIFGLSAPTGNSSSFHLRGALAPSYLFGSSTQDLTTDPGDQIEVQAVWSKEF